MKDLHKIFRLKYITSVFDLQKMEPGAAEIIPNFEEKLSSGEFKCAECDGSLELYDIIIWD